MSRFVRIASVDIFRALTMFLMIFVNDLWTLKDVPRWLGHANANEDYMGLADWVFPGFLFIVGLSIPLALEARKRKNETKVIIFWHIIKRSVALVVMGVFMVNLENVNDELLPFSKYVWQILMATAFILIWNDYPRAKVGGKVPMFAFQITGVLLLIFLAAIYRGGSVESPTWLKTHWWGILGIIGWAYLLNATIYLIVGRRMGYILMIWVIFHMFNFFEFIHPFDSNTSVDLIVGASNYVSVASGMVASMLYMKFGTLRKRHKFLGLVFLLAIISVAYGLATRPEWGISKISGTPSWTNICAGISFASFGILYIVSDLLRQDKWASLFAPAGRSTLTCYLVPYFYYAVMMLIGIFLPESMKSGIVGIGKSLLFAYLIVFITGLLEKARIRLRI